MKTVEPQLKGAVSTWWNTTKVLDLSWDEFRDEFSEKFDNAELQSQLRAVIVSVRQTLRTVPYATVLSYYRKINSRAVKPPGRPSPAASKHNGRTDARRVPHPHTPLAPYGGPPASWTPHRANHRHPPSHPKTDPEKIA
ncbi:Retrotransposon gag domain [Cinara cedri]|uniref:Retrotransposon gag domain n=1 Tax=Cinara cedri TaxID=506608 RepID=A0A5E4MNY4_9HEMI|nr:Retrotransposon gag domain [Cinara cedri]